MRSAIELKLQRAMTVAFIEADAISIVLVPRIEQSDGAGTRFVDGSPRPAQTFCIVPPSGGTSAVAQPGLVQTTDGKDRMGNYMLIGAWNATVEIGDHWYAPDTVLWEVLQLFPDNEYELRAGVLRHG